MKRLLLVLLIALSTQAISAKIRKIRNDNIFEGEKVQVTAINFHSKKNPVVVNLSSGDGSTFASNISINRTKSGFSFTAPDVARTRILNLQVSGGNVPAESPEELPLIIFNKPDASTPNPSGPDEELEVTNIAAESLIFENTSLSGNTNGELLWSGNPIANDQGDILGTRLTLNQYSFAVDNNGNLSYNSHKIVSPDGTLEPGNSLTASNNGTLTFTGADSITVNTTNGITSIANSSNGTLTLPSSGYFPALLIGEYDTTIDGGATGSRNLRNAVLPNNARVTRVWYEVLTTLTSATDSSTIGLSIPVDDVNGLITPIAINDGSNPWDTGLHSGVQTGLTSQISEVTTAIRDVQMTVSGETITAGRILFYIEYVTRPQ